MRAVKRVQSLGLSNCRFYQGNMDYFKGRFDIGVSLHACGVATDLVIQACIRNGASFVSCPCCYGSVQANHMLSYPRSNVFSPIQFKVSIRRRRRRGPIKNLSHLLNTQRGRFFSKVTQFYFEVPQTCIF